MVSAQELQRMFLACGGSVYERGREENASCLEIDGWQQFLCRLAMHWGRMDDSAPAMLVAERLSKLLQSIDNNEAMNIVRAWRAKGQTTPRKAIRGK